MTKRLVVIVSLLLLSAFVALPQQSVYGQIISPATNSFVLAGATQRISWSVTKDTTSIVVLQYTTDEGQTWNHIVTSGIAAGLYDWAIPATINSYHCKMRMVKYTNKGSTTLASTGNFSIAKLFWSSTINEVFSHRVIALTDTDGHHFNRIKFFR